MGMDKASSRAKLLSCASLTSVPISITNRCAVTLRRNDPRSHQLSRSLYSDTATNTVKTSTLGAVASRRIVSRKWFAAANHNIPNKRVRNCGTGVITAESPTRQRVHTDRTTRSGSRPSVVRGPSLVQRPVPPIGSAPCRRTPRGRLAAEGSVGEIAIGVSGNATRLDHRVRFGDLDLGEER
jgi:hypothetical protein